MMASTSVQPAFRSSAVMYVASSLLRKVLMPSVGLRLYPAVLPPGVPRTGLACGRGAPYTSAHRDSTARERIFDVK
jgi:hypothetical protein